MYMYIIYIQKTNPCYSFPPNTKYLPNNHSLAAILFWAGM